jgi:hypothetical protein
MRSELRVGRVRGAGANIALSTANQSILSAALDVPRGCVALVSLHAQTFVNNSWTYFNLEVDGTIVAPGIALSAPNGQTLAGSQTWVVPPGRRVLRAVASSNVAVGHVDPNLTTLAWVIAPSGGRP